MALTVRSDAGGTFGAVQFNAEDILRIDGAKAKAAPGKTLEASGAAVATVGGSYSINDSGGTPMVSITDAKRFQADFSNATIASRFMFQTSRRCSRWTTPSSRPYWWRRSRNWPRKWPI